MTAQSFFAIGQGLTLSELASECGGLLETPDLAERRIRSVAALETAGATDLAYFDNVAYSDALSSTRAGAVVTSGRWRSLVPPGVGLVVAEKAQLAFALAGRKLHPEAIAPRTSLKRGEISPQAFVHPKARLEDGVTVEAFASVDRDVEIGSGTVVSSQASIGQGSRIGRDCRIGRSATVEHALIGNRVILHPGTRIGQDGFGYVPGPTGLLKMVQIGRVVIQDDVEIGANTTIDRGAVRDTVIGEGTKIDNQVQVGHNVVIGRHCVIVAQVGIAGSTTIGDGVALGGQVGVNGHVTIGDGAQVAAASAVAGDVPPRARWGGTPARPIREWARETAVLRDLAKAGRGTKRDDSR